MIPLDTLRALTEADFYPDRPAEPTGIPALERARDAVGADPERFDSLLVTLKMLHKDNLQRIDGEDVARLQQANEAVELLQKAEAIFRELGSTHAADICNDLIRAAPMAARGPVYMEPLPPGIVDEHHTRLRPWWDGPAQGSSLLLGIKAYGKSRGDSEAATRGAVIRTIAQHIPKRHPERYAIVAELCNSIGYSTTAQSVRPILKGYENKAQRAKKRRRDALNFISR